MGRYLFFISLILFASCRREKETLISVDHDPKPVVYGIVSPEDGAKCAITWSISPVGDQIFKPVADALAILKKNGANFDTLSYRAPFYYSTRDITVDAFYRLDVTLDGFHVQSSDVGINSKVKIKDYENVIDSDSVITMTLGFIDEDQKKNVYHYSAYLIDYQENKYVPIKTGGPSYPTQSPTFKLLLDRLHYDGLDDGQYHSVSQKTRLVSPFYKIDMDSVAGVKYELISYSSEVIKFIQSERENSSVHIGSSSAPDPTWTNINGGYGYFGAYRKDTVIQYF